MFTNHHLSGFLCLIILLLIKIFTPPKKDPLDVFYCLILSSYSLNFQPHSHMHHVFLPRVTTPSSNLPPQQSQPTKNPHRSNQRPKNNPTKHLLSRIPHIILIRSSNRETHTLPQRRANINSNRPTFPVPLNRSITSFRGKLQFTPFLSQSLPVMVQFRVNLRIARH